MRYQICYLLLRYPRSLRAPCWDSSILQESIYLYTSLTRRYSLMSPGVSLLLQDASNVALLSNFTLTVVLQYYCSRQYRTQVRLDLDCFNDICAFFQMLQVLNRCSCVPASTNAPTSEVSNDCCCVFSKGYILFIVLVHANERVIVPKGTDKCCGAVNCRLRSLQIALLDQPRALSNMY